MTHKTDEEWQCILTPEQYRICRQGGTEPPFTGDLLHQKEKGHYVCVCCQHPLFGSSSKFDSGSGWPSFWEAYNEGSLKERQDTSHGMIRREVLCAHCDAHLGHVFNDGPPPTGLRFCINSAALGFVPEEKGNS